MSFIAYDLVFLGLCLLAFGIFIYKKKHNLKRQGLLYLYPTKVGIKFIDRFTKKYEKLLYSIQYIVIISGFLLMIGMVWMIVSFSYTYLSSSFLAQALKIPVLTPLIPYLPSLFHLDFLPQFYFTYWIIIIALIAIPHEFAHGIFARLNRIKVHSTGFGFLGPFLAAFVEPDEKKMNKSSIKAQMSVLAAGTFANVLTTIAGALLLWAFFAAAFAPMGVVFNTYSLSPINISSVSAINGISLSNTSQIISTTNTFYLNLTVNNQTYFAEPASVSYSLNNNLSYIVAYDDSPAFRAKLSGAISDISGTPITSYASLKSSLSSYSPGDNISVTTVLPNNTVQNYNLTLENKDGKAFLGIGVLPTQSRSGVMGWLYNVISAIKDPSVNYYSRLGDFGVFIYNLLWWIVIICFSVALVNMLPVGIFDGGRFFYLTVLAITRKEKIAEGAFKISTWIFIVLIIALMLKWVVALFF